jgi:hypothetical protein
VRAAGLEPAQAFRLYGFFLPLRLSPPPRGVRGLDYPFTKANCRRCCLSNLYTFPLAGAWLGSREPHRKRVAAMRHRSFAQEPIMPTGAETKTGPLCSSHLHKVRPYLTLPRYRTAAKDISDPLERFRFASGLRLAQSRMRLLLFL